MAADHLKLYFLALIPPQALRTRVKRLKEDIRDRFGAKHALKSPAHITLQMPFWWDEREEPRLLSTLGAAAAKEHAFHIELDGFDSFAPRVIFVRIANPNSIITLHQRLLPTLRSTLDIPPPYRGDGLHPHMTIATRDLRKAAFHEARAHYRTAPFEASFSTSAIWLLKHSGKHWDMHQALSFAPAMT